MSLSGSPVRPTASLPCSRRSTSAANALVLSNAQLEPNSVYAGVPAKKVKEITPEQRETIVKRTARDYQLYASWYKEEE